MEHSQKAQNPIESRNTDEILANQEIKKDTSKEQTADRTVERIEGENKEVEPYRAFGEKQLEEMTVEELGNESNRMISLLLNKNKSQSQLALEKLRQINEVLKEKKFKKELSSSNTPNHTETPPNQQQPTP